MARFVPILPSIQTRGIARLSRARTSFGKATALGALLFLLAALGSLVFRAAGLLRSSFAAWAAARREREQDRQLWELALADSRVMADLIALRQEAPRAGTRPA
jgi:hypothetical protein